MNVAIIPARGGSKRIPRKNIKLFHGKPIIAYSIQCALDSGCFDRVIVSTDDEEIAQVALKYGAEVPFMRPAELADDYATTIAVIKHAITELDRSDNDIRLVCCIYPAAPLLLKEDLQQGLDVISKQDNVEYVFSAVEYESPIQRAIRLGGNGEVNMLLPEYEMTRSQDLERTYHDAGQFYWGRKDAFAQEKMIYAAHSRIINIPSVRTVDIDTPQDWELAEAIFHFYKQRHEDRI